MSADKADALDRFRRQWLEDLRRAPTEEKHDGGGGGDGDLGKSLRMGSDDSRFR